MTRPRRPRMQRAARVGELLDSLLAGTGLNEKLKQYRAILIWDEVVGTQIAARTKPEQIRDGVLEVSVDQPVWMQQLQLLKPQILAKLNAQLGDGALREIFLKRGKAAHRPEISPPPAVPGWDSVQLPSDEIARLQAVLAPVADQELRSELESLLVKQAKLSKARDG